MSIVAMKEILIDAQEKGFAVAAFEFWSLDSAQTIVEAAELLDLPVILQAGPFECEYAGIENLAKIARMTAENSKIPVALHLDHGDTFKLVSEAIDAGFSSVMMDASHLPYDENVEATKEVVRLAEKSGITVEGELGKIGGDETGIMIEDSEAMQTDPIEAVRFVEETGIDVLAVSIGTVHGFYRFSLKINIPRLKDIASKVDIPLVLHGGSGTPDVKVIEAIKSGISKVNICTEFIAAFGEGYVEAINMPGFKYSVPTFFGKSREKALELACAKMKLFSMKT